LLALKVKLVVLLWLRHCQKHCFKLLKLLCLAMSLKAQILMH
jgi:hypothetical protein